MILGEEQLVRAGLAPAQTKRTRRIHFPFEDFLANKGQGQARPVRELAHAFIEIEISESCSRKSSPVWAGLAPAQTKRTHRIHFPFEDFLANKGQGQALPIQRACASFLAESKSRLFSTSFYSASYISNKAQRQAQPVHPHE